MTRTRHSRSNLLNRIFITRGRRTVYSSSAWLTKETVHPLPSHYNKNKHSFRGFISASGAMLILYQLKNRRSIFCVPTKRLSKTAKPIGAVRETAMGSRSPAGQRRLGTATRMNASLSRRLSAFFGSATDQGPKAAKFAVLTPGHAGFPNRAKRSEGSDTTPHPKRPVFRRVSRCARFGGWGGVFTRQSPLKRALRRLWAMCERSLRILFRQRRNESYRGEFFLLTMPCFGDCSPLFTRSIKAQDKGPQSQAPAARPQSPAVRGFSGKRQPQSVWRFSKTIAVGHPAKSRVCRALRRF